MSNALSTPTLEDLAAHHTVVGPDDPGTGRPAHVGATWTTSPPLRRAWVFAVAGSSRLRSRRPSRQPPPRARDRSDPHRGLRPPQSTPPPGRSDLAQALPGWRPGTTGRLHVPPQP